MAFLNIGLSLLSSNTCNKADRRKLLSAEARRILSFLTEKPLGEKDIKTDKNGRPFFPDFDADFNISHSGSIAAVSMVSGEKSGFPANLRTGCDIELVRPRVSTAKIAEMSFSSSERDYIFSGDCDNRFFTIWTLKECFLKLRGLSVFDMKKVPSFISAEGGLFSFEAAVSLPLSFYAYELQGISGEIYFLSVAIEGKEQLKPKILWVSQSFLPVRSIAEIKAAPSPTETVRPKI